MLLNADADDGTMNHILPESSFSEMIQGNLEGENGYGISAYLTDNEYDLLVVDAETQTVTIRKESAEPGEGFPIPFEKFISLDLTNAPWELLVGAPKSQGNRSRKGRGMSMGDIIFLTTLLFAVLGALALSLPVNRSFL